MDLTDQEPLLSPKPTAASIAAPVAQPSSTTTKLPVPITAAQSALSSQIKPVEERLAAALSSTITDPSPSTSDKFHQGISGIAAFLCGVAAIWSHVFNRDDLAAGFTATASLCGGYCAGHMKASQPDSTPPAK